MLAPLLRFLNEVQIPLSFETGLPHGGSGGQQWKHALSSLDWSTPPVESLYWTMDLCLNISYPPLKRAVPVFSSLKMSNSESHIQYFDQVKHSMLTGGLGTREAFDLSLDRLTIILTKKGLPDATQVELFEGL